jgi:hypothetical protein
MMCVESKTAEFTARLIRFLLYGIGCGCQRCREMCVEVVIALGLDVIPDLKEAARHVVITPLHTKRLAAVIEELTDRDGTSANPIPGMLRALLALVATEQDEDIVVRSVGMMASIVGRHTLVCVLIDELCEHYRDCKYAPRLINAIACLHDALSARHYGYLKQIAWFGPSEVAGRCEHLLKWIRGQNSGKFQPHVGFSDPIVHGLKLIVWLERTAVVGPDTTVSDPEWIWMRQYQYLPMIVNRGPILDGFHKGDFEC